MMNEMIRYAEFKQGLVTMAKYMIARDSIFREDSHYCTIVCENGEFFAECSETLDRKKLDNESYHDTLHQIYYDLCVSNPEWFGVS